MRILVVEDEPGLDLCRQLRSDDAAVPVLMLTARGGLDDRV